VTLQPHPLLGRILSIAAVMLAFGFACSGAAGGEPAPQLYSTGKTLEIDRCASAWLIKRYVDPGAVFKFYPDGALIEDGIAFDTPDAQLVRTHNRSTFQVIVDTYGIKAPGVDELAAIIHEVEINFWSGDRTRRTQTAVRDVDRIIASSPDNQQCLNRCFEYFDKFIKER
jgi:hypothetical protein